ncbi:hypothetical protein Gpo141_00010442 [Globisporangium polare]
MDDDERLLRRVAERTGRTKPEALPTFRVAARAHWETYFKLSKAEGNNVRRDFERMLKTDGYAVSILLSKAKASGATLSPDINLAGERVVSVDLVSWAWLEKDGKPTFSHYSSGPWWWRSAPT